MVNDVDAGVEGGGTTTIEGEDGGGGPFQLPGPLQLPCEGRVKIEVEVVDAGGCG